MKKTTTLLLFLLACTFASGQTVVPVVDDTPNSAVDLKGSVKFGKADSFDCPITGHNNSSKPIVAIAVELRFVKPDGTPGTIMFQHDHYFKDTDIAAPGADFEIGSTCNAGHEVDIVRQPAKPEAHVRVLFIQYGDASVWGSPKVAQEMIAQRAEALVFYQSLKSVRDSFGMNGLAQALTQNQKPGTTAWASQELLRKIRDVSGLQAASDWIDNNLARSAARQEQDKKEHF